MQTYVSNVMAGYKLDANTVAQRALDCVAISVSVADLIVHIVDDVNTAESTFDGQVLTENVVCALTTANDECLDVVLSESLATQRPKLRGQLLFERISNFFEGTFDAIVLDSGTDTTFCKIHHYDLCSNLPNFETGLFDLRTIFSRSVGVDLLTNPFNDKIKRVCDPVSKAYAQRVYRPYDIFSLKFKDIDGRLSCSFEFQFLDVPSAYHNKHQGYYSIPWKSFYDFGNVSLWVTLNATTAETNVQFSIKTFYIFDHGIVSMPSSALEVKGVLLATFEREMQTPTLDIRKLPWLHLSHECSMIKTSLNALSQESAVLTLLVSFKLITAFSSANTKLDDTSNTINVATPSLSQSSLLRSSLHNCHHKHCYAIASICQSLLPLFRPHHRYNILVAIVATSTPLHQRLSHRCYGTFMVDISYFIFIVLRISVGYQIDFFLIVPMSDLPLYILFYER